jgi:alanyl-tRNA synthetase
MRRLTSLLKTPREDVPQRVQELVDQVKNLEKAISKASADQATSLVPSLIGQAETRGRVEAVIATVENVDNADELRSVAQGVLAGLANTPGVVAVGSVNEGRATLVVAVNEAAADAGAHAGDMVKKASALMGGGGGGKPLLAQGGGPQGDTLDAALSALASDLDSL